MQPKSKVTLDITYPTPLPNGYRFNKATQMILIEFAVNQLMSKKPIRVTGIKRVLGMGGEIIVEYVAVEK